MEAGAAAEAGPGPGRTALRAQSSGHAHSLRNPPGGALGGGGAGGHRNGVRGQAGTGTGGTRREPGTGPPGTTGLSHHFYYLFIYFVKAPGNGEMRKCQGERFSCIAAWSEGVSLGLSQMLPSMTKCRERGHTTWPPGLLPSAERPWSQSAVVRMPLATNNRISISQRLKK